MVSGRGKAEKISTQIALFRPHEERRLALGYFVKRCCHLAAFEQIDDVERFADAGGECEVAELVDQLW